MITTVCMNPSFDKTTSVKQLCPGDVNRLHDVRLDAGGKGINVATVLKRLNVPVRCIGCIGEENGERFLTLLQQEGIVFDAVVVPGEIRTNLKLLDESQSVITEFNEPGLKMDEQHLADFLRTLSSASISDYVVLCGSLPAGCPAETYQQCMRTVSPCKCILDTSGDALLHGIKERPYLIKPNLPELEDLLKREIRTLPGIRDAAYSLMTKGAQNVVISMGKQGAMLVTETTALFAPSLSVKTHSTVGAGDAMVGGILAGLSAGEDLPEAFRYGVAAGAASVMTEGTQLIRKADFDALLPKVMVQEV